MFPIKATLGQGLLEDHRSTSQSTIPAVVLYTRGDFNNDLWPRLCDSFTTSIAFQWYSFLLCKKMYWIYNSPKTFYNTIAGIEHKICDSIFVWF